MTCRYTTSTEPRVITGRHTDDCHDDQCAGCQPCREPHCRVCRRAHADGTCAECLAESRDNLREIGRLCDALPEEVEHRGVEGEALMLLGPVADPEAWGHVTASVAAGRLPREWVEEGGGELHPLTVLLSHQMVWRDALDHDEAPDATLATAVDYLDRTLSYMAGYPHVPFEDFAQDVRRCRGHLEAVLHDGEQVDRTQVPCLTCGQLLERRFGNRAAEDHHACPSCRRQYNGEEFGLAKADWLTSEGADRFVYIADAALAIDRSEYTIRTWIRREVVTTQRSEAGRLLVWWPEVRAAHRDREVRDLRKKAV